MVYGLSKPSALIAPWSKSWAVIGKPFFEFARKRARCLKTPGRRQGNQNILSISLLNSIVFRRFLKLIQLKFLILLPILFSNLKSGFQFG
jgi:hypothetical protein